MAYASLDELKQQLDISDDDNDVDLQRALDAAATAIDHKAGRRFSVTAADETKLYYPTSENELEVVDLIEITSIKTDSSGNRTYGTTLATTDYELLPYNDERYQRIRMWPTSSRAFGPGRLVQIVGRFGYVEGTVDIANDILGTPPVGIRQANLLLAARLYKRKEAPFGILSATDLGTYARLSAEDPDVLSLLRPYKRSGVSTWVLV